MISLSQEHAERGWFPVRVLKPYRHGNIQEQLDAEVFAWLATVPRVGEEMQLYDLRDDGPCYIVDRVLHNSRPDSIEEEAREDYKRAVSHMGHLRYVATIFLALPKVEQQSRAAVPAKKKRPIRGIRSIDLSGG
ncbi:hypothetical protein [Lacunimicrobium album]